MEIKVRNVCLLTRVQPQRFIGVKGSGWPALRSDEYSSTGVDPLLPYLSSRFQRYLEVSSLEIENNRKGTRSEVGILCPCFDNIFRGSFITVLMLDVLLLRVESADATKYMRYIRDILLETCKFLLI